MVLLIGLFLVGFTLEDQAFEELASKVDAHLVIQKL